MERYEKLPVYQQAPAYHMESPQSRTIIAVTTRFALEARDALLDAVDQLWVHSATWGLALWEQLLGIPVDESRSDDSRRSVIITRMMGMGTCDRAMIRNIAKAITGYASRVTEHFSDYTFSIQFVGAPPGFVDIDRAGLIAAVEEVKPAHLRFVIQGITWADLEFLGYTWARIHQEEMTWRDLAQKVMLHPETSDGN